MTDDDGADATREQQERAAKVKANLDLTVARIVEEQLAGTPAREGLGEVTVAFRRLLADQVYALVGRLSHDLPLFAKHAKRSTVNADDVLLYARRNPNLQQNLMEFKQAEDAEKAAAKKSNKP